MELHKPDFMQGKDKGKQGRDQKKKKKKRAATAFAVICAVRLRLACVFLAYFVPLHPA